MPKRTKIEEPVMSDATILVSVEDLINEAMGPAEKNKVNYKMVQTILHILARQLRLLSTRVDIRVSPEDYTSGEKTQKKSDHSNTSPTSSKHEAKDVQHETSPRESKVIKIHDKPEKEQKDKHEAIERDKSDKEPAEEREKRKEKDLKKEKKLADAKEGSSPKKRDDKSRKEKDQEELKMVEEMSPKEKAKYLKEKEEKALQEMSPKEKAKYLKEKEEKALQEMSPKERQKYLKEKERSQLDTKKSRTASLASISIREVERNKEKVLIVEKGLESRSRSRTRLGTIDVVTHSEFALLEEAVKQLKETAAPPPMPSLPDNDKLRSELVKGNASLTDTMEALKVSARVQAAEQGLSRMAGLLTQLAGAGALPDDFAAQLEEVAAEIEALQVEAKVDDRPGKGETKEEYHEKPKSGKLGAKSVAIAPIEARPRRSLSDGAVTMSALPSTVSQSISRPVSIASGLQSPASERFVTRPDFESALERVKDDLLKNINTMTNKASSTADSAAGNVRSLSDKMQTALHLDERITQLFDLTSDYAEQLTGFDAGLVTQMASFNEQMQLMREDLKGGLELLATVNNNAETAAVMGLTERYEGLVVELDSTTAMNKNLTIFQHQLGEELQNLVEAVEMMREQKADREEVQDGLRDKADNSKLVGLLTEQSFATARLGLEQRLDLCYNKFHKQEIVWMEAIKDLSDVLEQKAEIMKLFSIKEEAQKAIREINEKLAALAIQLGEPKAALFMRLISADGVCGACQQPALMEPREPSCGQPPPLPALGAPPDAGEPCAPQHQLYRKSHVCKRWAGGSHTMMPNTVTRAVAAECLVRTAPVKKYLGYGADGKPYNMEEELRPCIECNKLSTDNEDAVEPLRMKDYTYDGPECLCPCCHQH